MTGPSDNMVLVFRVSSDGSRKVGQVGPEEVFYCACTQRVHVEDRDAHKEICHESCGKRNHN